MRKLTLAGSVLWIIGMAAFIIGMNLTGDVKEWMSVGGSVAFFIGLAIMGVVWMKTKNKSQQEDKKEAADRQ